MDFVCCIMLEDNTIIQSKYQYSTMFLEQAQSLYSVFKKR